MFSFEWYKCKIEHEETARVLCYQKLKQKLEEKHLPFKEHWFLMDCQPTLWMNLIL